MEHLKQAIKEFWEDPQQKQAIVDEYKNELVNLALTCNAVEDALNKVSYFDAESVVVMSNLLPEMKELMQFFERSLEHIDEISEEEI